MVVRGLRDLEEGHVVVDGVGVVVGVEDGRLDGVLELRPLLLHQVVLAQPHEEVLPDAVGGGEDPPGGHQGPAAEDLAVLVEDGHLPGPAAFDRLASA